MRRRAAICVLVLIMLTSVWGFAQDKYVPKDNEELYGTWTNSKYGVLPMTWQKIVVTADGYKEYELAKTTYDGVPTASLCSSCFECVARCANGLNIAERMRQARSLLA